jgi:ketosteroid isomerase-like protein
VKIHHLLASGIILLSFLHSTFALSATIPPAANGIDRVWFGTFTNTRPDGKISHDMATLILEQDGSKLSGSVGPSIDRLSPFVAGSISGNDISFHIESGGGIAFALRLNDGHLIGTATGSGVNAALDLAPAPGLMPHAELVTEITAADARNFAAYESCNADQYMASLSPDLEFYQDNQPVKNRQKIIDSLNYRCAEGINYRRELDQSALIINSAPPYDAIEAGLQRIYSKQPDGSEHLEATVRFTMVWSKKSGTWQLIRVVSYDHR